MTAPPRDYPEDLEQHEVSVDWKAFAKLSSSRKAIVRRIVNSFKTKAGSVVAQDPSGPQLIS